jgi:DNA-directed RNA polymerase specialized sigma24 family protein/CheY-like chemotaxis protein
MPFSEKIAVHIPYLRRFARAVTGSQKSGDSYVVAALEAILADPMIVPQHLPPRIGLYRIFLKVLNSTSLDGQMSADPGPASLAAAQKKMAALAPPARQAFLLVAVEEFSSEEAALILDVDKSELSRLFDEAGKQICRQMATNVVIIEDEPLIALDLQRLVTELGHRVARVARTASQAVEAVKIERPGLVLADIRLADGSSGLDAVNEILATVSVPVIFITAFPQQLLTGARPEPTFLITKPFQPEGVKAVISQALFFDVRNRGAHHASAHQATMAVL